MNYYRKNVDNTANDLKLKMQMAAFTLKLSENNDKIDDLVKADKDIKKDITDNSNSIKNFYTKQDVNNIISQYYLKKYLYDKTEIDKKDNEILNKVNNNFYSRSYINDNYHLKNNVYDKDYIDNNLLLKSKIDEKINSINDNFYTKENIDDQFYNKRELNNSFASYNTKIDSKNNELYEKIKNEYYDKNHINTSFNNLYNRTYLDNKFDNIYSKTEVNDKTTKLDRNVVLFNQNLTKFIDQDYKNDKETLEADIKENKNKFDNFFVNTFSAFSNNISNINNTQNNRLTDLEDSKINETQINKINQLENIDLNKIHASYNYSVFNKAKLDKMRYYIKEFIPFNITLIKKFAFTGNTNEIMILQFELDQRTFDINDIINFFLNMTIQYDNSKSNWYRLKLKLDVLYDDDTLIKSFVKMPVSKGFLY